MNGGFCSGFSLRFLLLSEGVIVCHLGVSLVIFDDGRDDGEVIVSFLREGVPNLLLQTVKEKVSNEGRPMNPEVQDCNSVNVTDFVDLI